LEKALGDSEDVKTQLPRVLAVIGKKPRDRFEFLSEVIPASPAKWTSRHLPLVAARAEVLFDDDELLEQDIVKEEPTCLQDAEALAKLDAPALVQAWVYGTAVKGCAETIKPGSRLRPRLTTKELTERYLKYLSKIETLLEESDTYSWRYAELFSMRVTQRLEALGEQEKAARLKAKLKEYKERKGNDSPAEVTPLRLEPRVRV